VVVLKITKSMENQLIDISYEIIKEEKLPKPGQIKFLSPLSGIKKRLGTCIHRKIKEEFKIIVYTTIADYVDDENGNLINKKTNKKVRRLLLGKELSINEVKHTLAHEIAHLKFWKHDAKHKSYTEHLYKKILAMCP